MPLRRLLFASTLLAAGPVIAHAQSRPELGEVVVTASRLEGAAETSPYSVALIPAAKLAGQPTVADALAGLAEIQVQAPGGRSGSASVFLRGADPNFTAVMLDGVPLNNPTNTRGGSVNVSEIDAAAIERVEVVSAPLSGLYGSGALAGAVNLIVPGGAERSSIDATAGIGTRDDYLGALRWRGPLGAGLGASVGLTASDDGDASADGRFKTWAVTGKLDRPGRPEAGRVILRYSGSLALAFPDSSGGPRYATRRGRDKRDGREGLVGVDQPLVATGPVKLDVSGSYLTRRDKTASPGVAPSAFDQGGVPAGKDDSRYKRTVGGLTARAGGSDLSLAVGLEAQHETGRSRGALSFVGASVPNGFDLSRNSYSGFVEASRKTERWSLDAGARLDDVDGIGTHATARARAPVPSARGVRPPRQRRQRLQGPELLRPRQSLRRQPGPQARKEPRGRGRAGLDRRRRKFLRPDPIRQPLYRPDRLRPRPAAEAREPQPGDLQGRVGQRLPPPRSQADGLRPAAVRRHP
jgi:outer membrane receptor protein involved in Fe transport